MTSTTPHLSDLDALSAEEPFVRALARSLLFDDHKVDDVVQQTWIEALRRGLPSGSARRGWLARVVRTRASNEARGERRRTARERAVARPEAVASPEEMLARAEQRRQVVTAVAELAEPYRSAIMLRYFEGHEPRDIARDLDLSIDTVQTRLKRARAMLRERLDATHGGDRRSWMVALVPLAAAREGVRTLVMAKTLALFALLSAMKPFLLILAGLVLSIVLARSLVMSSNPQPEPVRTVQVEGENRAAPVRSTDPGEGPAAEGTTPRVAIAAPGPDTLTPVVLDADQRGALTGVLLEADGRIAANRACRLLCLDPVTCHPGAFEPGSEARGAAFSSLETTTDATGRFTFTAVPARQSHALWLGHGGPNATLRTLGFELPAGRTTDLGTLALEPRGAIVGRIVDADGAPLAGARIRAIDVPGAMLGLAPIDRLTPGGALFVATPDPEAFVGRPDGAAAYAKAVRKFMSANVPQADADAAFSVLPFPSWFDHAWTSLPIPEGVSDAAGHFRIEGLVDDDHALLIEADGFARQMKQRIALRNGEVRDAGDIAMRPGESIDIRVLDADGRPVRGAEVRIALRPRLGLTGILFADPMRVTDAAGGVVFDALPRGDFVIAYRRGPGARWNIEPAVGSGAEIDLKLPATRDVALVVTGAGDEPLDGVTFELWDGPPLGEATAAGLQTTVAVSVDKAGSDRGEYLLLALEPGLYTLAVTAPGHALQQRLLHLTGADESEPISVELEPGVDCTIEIVDPDGRPIRAAEVFVLADADERAAFSQSILFSYGGFSSWDRLGRGGALTDTAGRVRVAGLPKGPATILVRHRARGRMAHSVTDLGTELRIVMQEPGSVEGTVLASGLVAKPGTIELTLQPSYDPGGRLFPDANHGVPLAADGTFRVDGLAPGEWEFQLKRVEEAPARSIGALVKNANPTGWWFPGGNATPERVQITSGATAHVALDVDPLAAAPGAAGALIRGSVRVDGAPRAGVHLRAHFPYDSFSAKSADFAVTDAAGRFERTTVANREFMLVAVIDEEPLLEWQRDLTADAGAVVDLDFVVDRVAVRIDVARPDGSPAAGCGVNLGAAMASGGSVSMTARADETGALDLLLPRGEYWFYAECAAGSVRQTGVAVAGATAIELRLTEDGVLRGRVLETPGREAEMILFRRADGSWTSMFGLSEGKEFVSHGMQATRYDITIFADDGEYVGDPAFVEIPEKGPTDLTVRFGSKKQDD